MNKTNQATQGRILNLTVFFCGGCVMILELTGSRLMAPYLGTSIFVWTSLIGAILSCLSLGYWLGGQLADKRPDVQILSRILLFSGLSVAVIALLGDIVLILMQRVITDVRLNSAIVTILLFGTPGLLLGMVAPFAVRLKLSRIEQTGTTAGGLYALSTVGSIVGTFLAGFILLSYFSHRTIFFAISLLLVALSFLTGGKKLHKAALLSFTLVFTLAFTPSPVSTIMGPAFIEEHTAYNRVWIYEGFKDERPVRVMQLNDTLDSIRFLDGEDLVLDYAKHFDLAGHFKPDLNRTLLIGGGALTYPMHFLSAFPLASMDVVEIDPKLTQLAKKWFGLQDNPRLRILHEDGRTYLNRTREKYDVVFGDAYKSYSVPFQLATAEAMQRIYDCLTEDGLFLVNIISGIEGENGQFLRAFLATVESVFPQVLLFSVQNTEDAASAQNLTVIAFKDRQSRNLGSENKEISSFLAHQWTKDIPRDKPVMKDALAPVERYAESLIVKNPEFRSGFIQKKLTEYLSP